MVAPRTGGARGVGTLDRPPGTDIALIVVAVCAVSTSAPLIRVAAAPAFAVAFWRNGLASLLLTPVALARCRAELLALSRHELSLAVGAGVLLAAHFATWVPSLSFTPVASSVALVATQPIWAALIARVRGERVPRRAWLGIVVAVAGAVVLTGVDLRINARFLLGDVLAMAGGVFAAAYVTVGAEVRRSVSTTSYTLLCYATAGVLLLVCCVTTHQRLVGYSAKTWACLAGLTLGAQLLGHSVFNRVLRTTSPTVVSLAILFEIVGAAVLAAILFSESPPLAAIPAALLIGAGIVVVVRAGRAEPAVAGVAVVE
ncbi:MAG: DMT family transporter [Mycobacteriales bacterium]|nr:DMT family transporter [Frankia sp.]